jgi:hypothetical protein
VLTVLAVPVSHLVSHFVSLDLHSTARGAVLGAILGAALGDENVPFFDEICVPDTVKKEVDDLVATLP